MPPCLASDVRNNQAASLRVVEPGMRALQRLEPRDRQAESGSELRIPIRRQR